MRQTIVFLVALAVISSAGCSGTAPSESATAAKAPAYNSVDLSTAGSVSGQVRFAGKKPVLKKIDMDQDADCARLHGNKRVADGTVVVNGNGTLSNVFVYIKRGLEGKKFAPPDAAVTIDQKGCWFYPRVIGIQTGQTLNVTNSDPVTHNIHPLAQTNREWNHSQGPGDAPLARRFTQSETMIRVKCNIHNWMRSYIGVLDHPFFGVTSSDGSFQIDKMPPGKFILAAWQETLGEQEQPFELLPSGTTVLTFHFKGE